MNPNNADCGFMIVCIAACSWWTEKKKVLVLHDFPVDLVYWQMGNPCVCDIARPKKKGKPQKREKRNRFAALTC